MSNGGTVADKKIIMKTDDREVDEGMIKQEDMSFPKMKENIKKAGNLFYQYRACRREAATIYDIENIRHGVVFARTPLQMNDPFDSMIGFSVEKIYDECIDIALDQVEIPLDSNLRLIIKNILKYRIVRKTIEFIDALNQLKEYIFVQSKNAHVAAANLQQYIVTNSERLYKRCPTGVKEYFNAQSFLIFAIIIKDYQYVPIEEKTLIDALKIEDALKVLEQKTAELRDQTYLPFLRDFLSKVTVACFSASGWDNQLMWAHYANSYSGICVEYNFEKMDQFIGFMYPVEYTSKRPTLMLKDLGFTRLEDGKFKNGETDTGAILSYMLAKNKCWEYEDEWRIINIGDKPYTPLFLKAPFIESITFGPNLDEICKQLLWDMCQDSGIDCYQLVVNSSDYVLTREKLTEKAFPFDADKELEYINLLSTHTETLGRKISIDSQSAVDSAKAGIIDSGATINVLTMTLDVLSDAYFLKTSFNRYCKNKAVLPSEIAQETQIAGAILCINDFIDKAKLSANSINDSLMNLLIYNKIKFDVFRTVKRLTSDILEMVDKHCDLKWFGEEIQKNPEEDSSLIELTK